MTQDIRVERCPSCGARYNVTRLGTGASFQCRRCGVVVHVASEEPDPPSPSRGALGVACALLLGALGTRLYPWPPAWNPDVVLLGAVALAFAFVAVRPSPALFHVAAALLLLLLLRAEGPESPLSLGAPEPGVAFARIVLAGGFVALASRRLRARGAARVLALGGALGLLAAHATAPAVAPDSLSDLAGRAQAVATWWTDVVWHSAASAPGASPWTREIPWTLAALSGLVGVLSALLPARRTGPLVRFLARVGLALLLMAILAPHLEQAWSSRDDLLGATGASLAQDRAAGLLLHGGLAAWFAGAVLLAHAAWGLGAVPRGTRARARTGAWHAVAAALAAGTLLLLLNPYTGSVATAWPWNGLAPAGLGRDVALAVLVGGLAIASVLFGALPWTRWNGGLSALVAGLALMAVETGVPEHGVPRAALPLLLAVAAGVVWARRGGRWGPPARWAAAVSGAVALAIVLWPRSGTEIAVAGPVAPWDCGLLRWIAALPDALRGGELGQAFLRPGSMGVPVATLAGLLALVAAGTTPMRPLAWTLALLASAAALYPVGHALVHGAAVETSASASLEAALRAAGEALRLLPVPALIASLAATADVTGRLP